MAKQVYWLSDAEWRRIEPLLPRGRRGARRVDDRRVISGTAPLTPPHWNGSTPESGVRKTSPEGVHNLKKRAIGWRIPDG